MVTERDGLRLVIWNILEGFHRPGTRHFDAGRLDAAREVLDTLRPDVLVLNEALWCEEHEGHVVDYAGLLGFPHHVGDLYDGHWGNVVLSRLPIVSRTTFAIYNRSGVVAGIDMGCGRQVAVATYHPHPGRYPWNKAADFRSMAAAASGRPLVLCGDFNAISPEDRPDRDVMIAGFRRFSSKPGPDVDRFIDGGLAVFAALEADGLRDAIPPQGRGITMPTDLVSSDKVSGMRIDHVMISADVRCLHGEVIRIPATERASDHYPVVADLMVDGNAQPLH